MPDDLTPEQAVERALRGRFDRACRTLGVAVSGGGDSLALLLAAASIASSQGLILRAATVDHGLRPEATNEARYVAHLCGERTIGHHILSLHLADGPDLQARARTARYDALQAWAGCHDVSLVLLGHTQDDVAESLVMRLRRGVGLDGLARMPETWTDTQDQNWARPFLTLSRATLRAYLADKGVTPIEDPSNDDTRFERVEIRKALATLGWTDGALARSAGHLAQAAQSYDARLEELFDKVFTDAQGDLLMEEQTARDLAVNEIDSLRRLLLAALAAIGGGTPPREAEQKRLIAYVRSPEVPGITLAGCRILHGRGMLRICRELSACAPAVPFGTLWDNRWVVSGPEAPDLMIGALGADVDQTPWRDSGLPRVSAMTQPAVRRGDTLVSAPTVGLVAGYSAVSRADPRAAFRHRHPFSN